MRRTGGEEGENSRRDLENAVMENYTLSNLAVDGRRSWSFY
jgi:hypothetical protein